MSVKRWYIKETSKETAAHLSEECDMDPFLALLLSARHITTPEEAVAFLLDSDIADDPFTFADMDLAVERIQRAIDNHERIAVFGDYDADGITATVLLYSYLTEKDADALYFLPQREGEGYGLHEEMIDRLCESNVRLLVTVDNGISAVAEVAYAKSRGIETVITDHHRPQETLPDAVAVVNPHRPDCGSMCKDYAGVGVVFKLLCALDGDADMMMEKYGDLLAIGTLADVMPLCGEIRNLVRKGLAVLNENRRPGLVKLAQVAGSKVAAQTATSLVFSLTPRINAAGRMGDPNKAARLLLTQDEEEAMLLAEEVGEANTQRQTVEAAILKEALEMIQKNPAWSAARVLVLAGENWHGGVLGIIAARLMERFGKPCIVLSRQEDFTRGSGRSLKGFSLFEALAACGEWLLSFGGHELAAGVTMHTENIEHFRTAINAYAAKTCPIMPMPTLALECKLRPAQIDVGKLHLLTALEPYGAGNPIPIFGLYNMQLDNIIPVGGGKHLRLSLSRDGTAVAAMKFHTTRENFPILCGSTVNVAVTLDRNEYRGTVEPSIVIKDIRYAQTNQDDLLEGLHLFEAARRQELTAEMAAACTPMREELAQVYRALRKRTSFWGTLEQLYNGTEEELPSYAKLRVILEILKQGSLLDIQENGELLHITLQPSKGKTDLNETALLQYLHTTAKGERPA